MELNIKRRDDSVYMHIPYTLAEYGDIFVLKSDWELKGYAGITKADIFLKTHKGVATFKGSFIPDDPTWEGMQIVVLPVELG